MRTPVLERPVAMRLAATEYERFVAALRPLNADEWKLPTCCPPWDVRTMASHVLGMADMAASPFESRRQIKSATKRGGVFIDALTGLQVDERVELGPQQIVTKLE